MKPGKTVYATQVQERSGSHTARGFTNYKAKKGHVFVLTVWGVEDKMLPEHAQIRPAKKLEGIGWFSSSFIENTLGKNALKKLQKAQEAQRASEEKK